MVYIIHGNAMSTCTARVIVSFLAMGLQPEKDFKLESAEFTVLKEADWMAHQPFGQMPWMEDTEAGLEIFESRAIVSYVGGKIGSPLTPGPENHKAFAGYLQAAQNESAQFDGPASTLAFELYFSKWFGIPTNEENAKKQKDTLAKKLEGYERILSKSKYLGGENLTVADLSHLAYGALLSNIGAAPTLTDGSLPNVARWWKDISANPAWAKTKEMGHPEHGKA
ncbi:glutathione S-transferase [Dioszegia hungarica]|uniref:glutathione transferase n=1 Tax=Dioszegia hungarica TaxID=4972 RepID=A0AA38LV58_9TREE|nr:glutathione S-transferase [Dioszegia hungarica]KAI9636118.1 glutathione S-transferase [Dioszegia hungarica]